MGFKQGEYTPKIPSKCFNLTRESKPANPVYRSSWELELFKKLEMLGGVLGWGSELTQTKVRYLFTKISTDGGVIVGDNEEHTYNPDVYVEVGDPKSGRVRAKFLIEVKPERECYTPQIPTRKTSKAMARYATLLEKVHKNRCKWETAKVFANSRGWTFLVFTEETIFKRLDELMGSLGRN